jgi:hypothetical protein
MVQNRCRAHAVVQMKLLMRSRVRGGAEVKWCRGADMEVQT